MRKMYPIQLFVVVNVAISKRKQIFLVRDGFDSGKLILLTMIPQTRLALMGSWRTNMLLVFPVVVPEKVEHFSKTNFIIKESMLAKNL